MRRPARRANRHPSFRPRRRPERRRRSSGAGGRLHSCQPRRARAARRNRARGRAGAAGVKVWNLFRGICRPFPVRLHTARQAGGLWTSDAAAGFARLNLRASFVEVTGAFVRVRPSVQHAAHHGGGAFSGKDPSKVDRSAAYAGRYVAKNIVAAGLAKRCEIQVSYAIGVAEPTSVMVNTFGTGTIPDDEIIKRVRAVFDLTPYGIIEMLDLIRPIYRQTAAYGHFGRELPDFTWEKTDRADALKR